MSNIVNPVTLDEVESSLENDAVVLFTQPRTCQPCRQLKPHFESASTKLDTTFIYVDLDKVPDAALEYGVMGVPTVVLFRDGERVTDLKERTAPLLVSEIKSYF